MKKSFIILFLLYQYFNSFSQICTTGNEWNYLRIEIPTCSYSIDCSGVYYELDHYKVGGDTVINAKTYKTILLSIENLNGKFAYSPAGFLREEENGKKVYSLSTLWNDPQDILIYDFTVQKDSTFNSTYTYSYYLNHTKYTYTDTYFKSKVINIDSIDYEGSKRLRIQFEDFAYAGILGASENVSWIEGIGSSQELLHYPNSFGSILLCFKQNDITGYLNNYGFDCDYKIIDKINVPEIDQFNIISNPSQKGAIFINSTNESVLINQLSVFNLQGSLLMQYQPKVSFFTLNNLISGVYLLKINNSFKKVIVP